MALKIAQEMQSQRLDSKYAPQPYSRDSSDLVLIESNLVCCAQVEYHPGRSGEKEGLGASLWPQGANEVEKIDRTFRQRLPEVLVHNQQISAATEPDLLSGIFVLS